MFQTGGGLETVRIYSARRGRTQLWFKTMNLLARATLLLIVITATAGSPALAQSVAWDAAGPHLSRSELEHLLERYEGAASSSSYSARLRRQAAADAELIRLRLAEGDVRVGDLLHVIVEGHEQLSDTFNVRGNRTIVLPDIGEIPLTALLRSELEQYLTDYIGRYIVSPVVRVRSLIRLEILGAVMRPGYYDVPSESLLSDALMIAGGLASSAAVDQVRIQRGAATIMEPERVREALVAGRTLDQLNIRAGDGIQVPEQRSRVASVRNVVVFLTGIISAVVLASQAGLF